MLTTTTPILDGKRIRQYLGVVRGIVVRSPTLSQGFFGGLKSIIGGNIGSYRDMCEQARQQAFDEMVAHGDALGANAIVGVHYDASELGGQQTCTEVLCYGTAVITD